MLWLAILLPALPLQVFTRGARADTAIAVTAAPAQACILAASPFATAAGVRPGQRSASALALLPELQLHARAPEREARALHEIASWAARFTPRLSLSPPDAVLLEIGSCLRLFGNAQLIEAEVQAGLRELGFEAHTACAPTALAARWFARANGRSPTAADWLDALERLPLDVLGDEDGCDAATLALLAGLGLRTLAELHRLPAAGLARRGAQAAMHCLARARGETPDPRPWFEVGESFDCGLALPAPTHHAEALLFAARRLFASLGGWLRARHAAIDHCRLLLEHEYQPATGLELVLGSPSQDECRLLLIARERLGTLQLAADVSGLRLLAEHTLAAATSSTDLFDDSSRVREQADLLLDRLRARLGRDRVSQLRALPDHRPEAAWAGLPHPPAGRTGARAVVAKGTLPAWRPPATDRLRPLWLLPTPRSVDPDAFVLLSEAERIECGWWDEQPVCRDYYLARDTRQALCWIYQCLDKPQAWYLHGYFG
ncbi:Y-family DNA polymerase [Thauera sp. WH-1]|uniref:Y-family DNA polymerase n=1 Tax=Thauera sp. WH-1 TaxID=3398230 RepID=UPI0039FDC79B